MSVNKSCFGRVQPSPDKCGLPALLLFCFAFGGCSTTPFTDGQPVKHPVSSQSTIQADTRSAWRMAQDARALRRPGRWDEAAAAYQMVLDRGVDTDSIRQEYGDVLIKAGRFEEAVVQYRTIVERPAEFAPSSAVGTSDEGVYGDSVTRDQYVTGAWFSIAVLCVFHLHRYEEALQALDAYEARTTDKGDAYSVVLLEYRGRALEGLGRTQEAINCYEAVLAIAKRMQLDSTTIREVRERLRVLSQGG